jgi:hypothetical protein
MSWSGWPVPSRRPRDDARCGRLTTDDEPLGDVLWWPGDADHRQTLAPKAELRDDTAVALDVTGLHVVEQTTPTTDQHEKSTTTVVVLRMLLQVLGEMRDTVAEERDLHLGRTCIGTVQAVLVDDLLIGHVLPLVLLPRRKRRWVAAGADHRYGITSEPEP